MMTLTMMIMGTNYADGNNDDAIENDDNDNTGARNYDSNNDTYDGKNDANDDKVYTGDGNNDYNDDNGNDGVGGLWEPDGGRGRPVSPIIYLHTPFATLLQYNYS